MFHGIKRLFLPVMDKFYANILNKSDISFKLGPEFISSALIAINEQILNK